MGSLQMFGFIFYALTMYQIIAYIIYLGFSVVTVWIVGKNLHRNGETFLFSECPDYALSHSANNFLYTGYCLVNTGFAFYFLNSTGTLTNTLQVIEFIIYSEGIIFISLGCLHLLNIIFAPRIISFFLSKKLNQY